MKTIHLTAIAAFGLAAGATTAFAVGNARISESAGRICISSNGLPEHSTGQFPNRSNPNAIRPQRVSVCVPANPKKGNTAHEVSRAPLMLDELEWFMDHSADLDWDLQLKCRPLAEAAITVLRSRLGVLARAFDVN